MIMANYMDRGDSKIMGGILALGGLVTSCISGYSPIKIVGDIFTEICAGFSRFIYDPWKNYPTPKENV